MWTETASDLALLGHTTTLLPKSLLVIAIERAQKGATFAALTEEIYTRARACQLNSNQAWLLAWQTAYRIRRGEREEGSEGTSYALTRDQSYLVGWQLASQLAPQHLLDYLQLGASSQEELLEILQSYHFSQEMLPYPNQHLAEKFIADWL